MLSPSQAYLLRINQHNIVSDEHQQAALVELDRVHQFLVSKVSPSKNQSIKMTSTQAEKSPYKGVYMWGDVGRGKTFLMDLFYECLPEGVGLRLHFHHFMARLHKELNLAFGQKNPLKGIAKRLASECQVLCFDEFFVSDIGDAMLLGGLIEALFEERVVLVATSNIAVENLFQNQLQKQRFAAPIALLQANVVSINLAGGKDHRLRHTQAAPMYFVQEEQKLEAVFDQMAQGTIQQEVLQVCGRPIRIVKESDNVVWFDFYDLCDGPRSSMDYMALAARYSCILVSGIPELSSEPFEHIKARGTEDGAIGSGQTGDREVALGINDDAVRRFISLVDECYDHQAVLFLNADVPLDSLYLNGSLLFEFRRTYSRLIEMASLYYQGLRAKS
ncbi:cell division protein ZapE [Marinomonas mediterranea]|uniref:cell division protein ZapE n=1 Tax=Marinomonas mediterranea TaxID=119864 RepID=UPI00234A2ACC|nr:cell division protein ZapE [Marinomonas mediterranea]WCN11000.1 cell division protein ZapE [Marinomonas mediterranea]